MNTAPTGAFGDETGETVTMPTRVGGAEPDPRRWSILAVVVIAQLMAVSTASECDHRGDRRRLNEPISVANDEWPTTAYTLASEQWLLGGRLRGRRDVDGGTTACRCLGTGGSAVDQAMLFGSRALQGASF